MKPRFLILVIVALVVAAAVPSRADQVPQRIVSVNIASDEILLALIPERLVAVSVLADDPEVSGVVRQARAIPVRVKADAERIVDLRPDLVVIGGHSFHVASQLRQLGLRVITIEGFESIGWIEQLVRTLGQAVGAPARAERMMAEMRERLRKVEERVAARPRPRVLTYAPSGYTDGRRTILDDVIRVAGGDNVAAALGIVGGRQISLEQVIAADPDAIVMSASQRWAPGFQSEFFAHPALRTVRAVRDRRVHQLPGRLMITASHHIVETVEALAAQLHPAAFAGAIR
jgi:iron complex transport system substrate-binding protein